MKYSNLILLISILFCSCSQIDDIATSQPKETNIDIFAAIDNSYIQTRGDESIEPFGDGDNLGLYILSHGATTPFAGNTNNLNIQATYHQEDSDSRWSYVMQSSSYVFSSLFITTNKEGETADFYAYSPWYSTNTYAKTYVKFLYVNLDISASQVDLKWARQNQENDNTNKGIVSDGNNKKVQLTFQRATALISCKFATQHVGNQEGTSEIHITGFKVNKGDCPLFQSGKLNIIDGEWTKTETDSYSHRRASTLELRTSTEEIPYPSTYDIYFLPITQDEMESSEGDDLMYITFNQYANKNGTPAIEGLPAKITLTKSQFPNGLQAGKKYTLYITWEDYLQIDNIQVDELWTDCVEEKIKEI